MNVQFSFKIQRFNYQKTNKPDQKVVFQIFLVAQTQILIKDDKTISFVRMWNTVE